MAEVLLKNINKVYDGNVVAVKDVSLEIRDREFMVLVGPSGCGKSTLLRMIAGLEEISAGDLIIDGKRCNEVAPKDRDIAMVFQNYALYPHMTVAQNLAFGLKLRAISNQEIRARVREAAERLGLSELLHRKPRALSGGQRQRVALGRAMVRKPKVFLFDEPLSNLDAKLRVQMRVEIARLAAQLETTMIYVTHDQTEAMTLGHRIACLRGGEIQQLGAPLELYKHPQNAFVAGFIGMPPMNFFPFRLEGETLIVPGTRGNWKPRLSELRALPGFSPAKSMLGIRPEHLTVAGENGAGLEADVDIVEPLGAETMVYCRLGDLKAVARLPAETTLRRGDKLSLVPLSTHLHFFEPIQDTPS